MSIASNRIEAVVKELLAAGEEPGRIASALLNSSAEIVIRSGHADDFLPLAAYSVAHLRPILEKLVSLERELKTTEAS